MSLNLCVCLFVGSHFIKFGVFGSFGAECLMGVTAVSPGFLEGTTLVNTIIFCATSVIILINIH